MRNDGNGRRRICTEDDGGASSSVLLSSDDDDAFYDLNQSVINVYDSVAGQQKGKGLSKRKTEKQPVKWAKLKLRRN